MTEFQSSFSDVQLRTQGLSAIILLLLRLNLSALVNLHISQVRRQPRWGGSICAAALLSPRCQCRGTVAPRRLLPVSQYLPRNGAQRLAHTGAQGSAGWTGDSWWHGRCVSSVGSTCFSAGPPAWVPLHSHQYVIPPSQYRSIHWHMMRSQIEACCPILSDLCCYLPPLTCATVCNMCHCLNICWMPAKCG